MNFHIECPEMISKSQTESALDTHALIRGKL